ncbi:MAG: glutamine synthetase family protein [Clostridia bacterium]|nr:glutamine synthetase family protein [Clostridia bacterium]
MLYTKNEVLQYVTEEDVKFIRLAFCDVKGCQKNISIMPGELERAFDNGIGIDASAIDGFGGNVHSDLFLRPDPSTLVVLPWRPDHGRVVRMFCEIMKPDGSHFELDSRRILKNAVKQAMTDGLSFSFGSELEFYLFKTDDEGKRTSEPYDNAGYMDIAPMDKGENVRREICLTLERMGIYPESSHHEEGPGQNEIDFKFSDPVTAADNAVTFLSVVKTIAARSGLYADFSPKPLGGKPGNSFHINVSAESLLGGDITSFAIAGILNRISDMTAFLNTSDSSYERLGKFKAPRFITWSRENRSQLIRIPAASGKYKRFELRSPDPLANPYLAYALIISAAAEGIKAKEELKPETDLNIFTLSEEEQKKYEKIPESKAAAASAAKGSEFIKKILPEAMIKYYCD